MPPDDDTTTPVTGEKEPARLRLGTAKFESVNAPTADSPPPVDVHSILQDNLAREKAAGLHDLAPLPPRRSRRRRDYLIALFAGNAFLAVGFVLQPVFAGAGFIIYNTGLHWVLFVVMDDY
jgi:hypothetical protein